MRVRRHAVTFLVMAFSITVFCTACGQPRRKSSTNSPQTATWYNSKTGKPASSATGYVPEYSVPWQVPDVEIPSGYIQGPIDGRDPMISADSTRCEQYGDSLPSAQALERREWARKCRYITDEQYAILKASADKTGKSVSAYPTFGIWSRDGKAYSNLAKYIAPTRKEASCDDFPDGYAPVINCWAQGWKAVDW